MKSNKIESHPEVKRFLDETCRSIHGTSHKLEVREEILSHLEAELEGVDADFDERLKVALEKFGDPHVLGRSLYVARRTWPQTLIKYSAASVLMALATLYLTSSYFMSQYQEVISKANDVIASRIPRFESEQREIAAFNFLNETSSAKSDAGTFLNSRIQWLGHDQLAEIVVPEIPNAKWNNEWLTADIPSVLLETNLTWVTKLKTFDHWDLFESGPNARFVGDNPELVSPFSFPGPDFSFLSRAAKLHLRRALDRGDVVQAFADIRHLARLVYTTESLVGSMTAVTLLKIERAAYEQAVKRKITIASDSVPFSGEAIARMKTTLWVTAGFADHAAPDVIARVFLDSKSAWPVGSCAALAETAQAVVLTSEFLKKTYPFEADTGEQEAVIHRVFEASKPHCRLVFHRQLLSRTQEYAAVIEGFIDFSMATSWWGRLRHYRYAYGRYLPYIRQGLGMELMATARPDFSGRYDRE